MKIWSLEEDVNYNEHIKPDEENFDWIEFREKFTGKSIIDTWLPIRVCLIEHGDKLKKGDMPYMTPGVPVFTKKAITILYDLLDKKAEILPLEYDNQELYLINIINLIDAIDYKKSDIRYMRDGKRILSIEKFSFKLEEVQKQYIFKLANQLYGTVFVTDTFKNRVIENGLQGFKFIEVWDSEEHNE